MSNPKEAKVRISKKKLYELYQWQIAAWGDFINAPNFITLTGELQEEGCATCCRPGCQGSECTTCPHEPAPQETLTAQQVALEGREEEAAIKAKYETLGWEEEFDKFCTDHSGVTLWPSGSKLKQSLRDFIRRVREEALAEGRKTECECVCECHHPDKMGSLQDRNIAFESNPVRHPDKPLVDKRPDYTREEREGFLRSVSTDKPTEVVTAQVWTHDDKLKLPEPMDKLSPARGSNTIMMYRKIQQIIDYLAARDGDSLK